MSKTLVNVVIALVVVFAIILGMILIGNALGISHPTVSIYTVKWSRMSERYDSSIRPECFCRPV